MGNRLGVALLAAGSSRRFGDADKLSASYQGLMVGEHAPQAIPVERFQCAWVVTAGRDHPCEPTWRAAGFEVLINPLSSDGMGTSVALAARAAMEANLDSLLIALADMPLVPRSHFEALIGAFTNAETIAVSAKDEARMPPAIFGKGHFKALAASSGDTGARSLLKEGEIVECPPQWLKDIDTVEDL